MQVVPYLCVCVSSCVCLQLFASCCLLCYKLSLSYTSTLFCFGSVKCLNTYLSLSLILGIDFMPCCCVRLLRNADLCHMIFFMRVEQDLKGLCSGRVNLLGSNLFSQCATQDIWVFIPVMEHTATTKQGTPLHLWHCFLLCLNPPTNITTWHSLLSSPGLLLWHNFSTNHRKQSLVNSSVSN